MRELVSRQIEKSPFNKTAHKNAEKSMIGMESRIFLPPKINLKINLMK